MLSGAPFLHLPLLDSSVLTPLAHSVLYGIAALAALGTGAYLFLRQRKAAAREELFSSILAGITDAVIIARPDGTISSINPVASKMTGWNAQEAVGKPICEVFQLFTADGRISIKEIIHEALDTGQPVDDRDGHYILVDRSGHEYNISYRFLPVRGAAATACALLVFRDINEHLILQDQLRQAQKLESVGRLAGGIAHDFNNMIGAISGTAEVMMLQLDEDDGLTRYVRRIFATATKASDLTNRLLSFTRKGTANIATAFSLNGIINEAIEIIERSMDPKVEIKTDFCTGNNTIIGDPSSIENAIINLCLNANDAMPRGGQLSICVTRCTLDSEWCASAPFAPGAGEYLVVTVSDTGVGITPDKLGRIYEPFFTTKEAGKGSGLGLAAVHTTMREHNGTISVESQVDVGTTFRLYFPLAEDQAPQRLEQESGTPLVRRGSGTILLVDDEEFMRDAGRLMLESLGYSVMLAENGKEAVDIYRDNREKIAVVILDMVMPRMNGSDAFKLIIELNPKAKVILSSGFSRETGITGLFAKGLKAFVKKPYRQSEIAEILADIIEEE